MNGRVYDYNLGRFMSVDPFIQAVGNSQSVNPYSYIMNNPLAGTDPSGYMSIAVGEHRYKISCSGDCPESSSGDSEGNESSSGETGSGSTEGSGQQSQQVSGGSVLPVGGGDIVQEINENTSNGSVGNGPSGHNGDDGGMWWTQRQFDLMSQSQNNQQYDYLANMYKHSNGNSIGASDTLNAASTYSGVAAGLLGAAAPLSPYWIANTKTKGLQLYATNWWKGNGSHNFKGFVSNVTQTTKAVGHSTTFFSSGVSAYQYISDLQAMRVDGTFGSRSIDLAVDLGVTVFVGLVGSVPAIIGGAAYFTLDTFVYNGNLSEAIANGQFTEDIGRSFDAIRELF